MMLQVMNWTTKTLGKSEETSTQCTGVAYKVHPPLLSCLVSDLDWQWEVLLPFLLCLYREVLTLSKELETLCPTKVT